MGVLKKEKPSEEVEEKPEGQSAAPTETENVQQDERSE